MQHTPAHAAYSTAELIMTSHNKAHVDYDDALVVCLRVHRCFCFYGSSHIGRSRVLVQWTKVVTVKMSLAACHVLCFMLSVGSAVRFKGTQRLAAGCIACAAGILGRLLLPKQ